MWKPARALRLRPDDREWLEALVHGGKTPQRVVLRARIVLGAAAGQSNHGLAKALGISRPTLLRWRQRYVEAGVGGLVFNPSDVPTASTQARAAFVYGGGADFNLTHRIFMRAEYRGLVYNSPTFDLAPVQGTDRVTHRAEPSIGFGYRF